MIQIIFILWLLICISYCVYTYYKKQYGRPLIALLSMVVIALILPPLVSFSVYFCLWHSRGHIVRLWHSLQQNQRLATVQEAIVYTLLSWISAVLFFFYLSGSISDIILQITFIGLAALTWPHMILVDYMDKKRGHYE
jgi:Brp/Blh family beta-carotene 15,15'-monooxygenase